MTMMYSVHLSRCATTALPINYLLKFCAASLAQTLNEHSAVSFARTSLLVTMLMLMLIVVVVVVPIEGF